MKKGTHKTKDGRTAKKGLWYNIHQKRKRGEKMRKKGAKGAPTDRAIRRSQLMRGGALRGYGRAYMASGGRTPAWQRKEGKNPAGGLNAKGRASYKKGNLKAPSKKVGNPRRASFCARMGGMKKKLTSAKTARDPNSRINKSLRAWNC